MYLCDLLLNITEKSRLAALNFFILFHIFVIFQFPVGPLCLDETVQSNRKSADKIIHNDISDLTADFLTDVLYAALLTGHNPVTIKTFKDRQVLLSGVYRYFRDALEEIGAKKMSARIADVLSERYTALATAKPYQLQKAVIFLMRCDLISVTPISDNDYEENLLQGRILSGEQPVSGRGQLFPGMSVCIRYPMLYLEILRELLGEHMPETLPRVLLDGIVKMHARGLLPVYGSYEYHDQDGNEVDYVSIRQGTAIEFSISNKSGQDLHFDCLQNVHHYVLLTQNISGYKDGVFHIPYYDFLAGNANLENIRSQIWKIEAGETG